MIRIAGAGTCNICHKDVIPNNGQCPYCGGNLSNIVEFVVAPTLASGDPDTTIIEVEA